MGFRLYWWPRYVLRWAKGEIEFSPTEGIILSRLVNGRAVSLEDITDTLYDGREDGGSLTPNVLIRVYIHRIRQKLKQTPFKIIRSPMNHYRLVGIGKTIDRIADRIIADADEPPD